MKTIVCLLAFVLLPLRAFATPITYIEAISGDLFVDMNPGPVLVPATTLNFDLGVNTVSGSSTSISFLLLQDRDGFVFTIPTGAELSNLTIDYTVALTNLAFADRSVFLKAGTQVDFPGAALTLLPMAPTTPTMPVSLFSSSIPLGPGTYSLVMSGGLFFRTDSEEPYRADIDYTISATVQELTPTPVPEPATLSLMATGLAAARWMRRRRS